ncbi:MAG: UvrD-helicase domain-containing protein [Sandaracinaceae bacterium]
MIDAEARRRIAEDLETSLVVEAAAGTGKTTALIGRMIAILRSGRARLEEIVAVTFTEKASGEMKLRLRSELERARAEAKDEEERARFEAALGELEAARIGTIHAFCADLLRERPVEAGVDPALELLTDDQEASLIGRAFNRWFERTLADPPEGVRRVLRRRGNPREQLLRAARDLVGRRDHPAPWRREPFDRDAAIDACVEAVRGVAALAELANAPNDKLAQNLSRLGRWLAELDAREAIRPRDHDGLEAELYELRNDRDNWKHRWFGQWYGDGLLRQDVLTRRDALAEELDRFLDRAGADLAPVLVRDLAPVVEAYEQLKARSGTLDFLDLLIRARDLVRDDAGVRAELRRRFAYFFVDEFQDTDPLQAEILLMLATDGDVPEGGMLTEGAPPPVPGKLFVVGDPKQSIYRFRRAEVSLYERIKDRLVAQGVAHLELSTSFRARPDIQRAINAAFAPLMQGSETGAQARYVPLGPHRPAPEGRPSVIALSVPRPYGRWGKIYKYAVADSAADAAGAFCDWLLTKSGWTVDDPLSGEARPLESRDICLLFRSTTSWGRSLVAPYVLALEARGLPHVLVGGRAFHDREEVLALATALRAIEHPGDALSVYATLRGPFFGMSDEDLLLYRETQGPLNPLVHPPEALWGAERSPVADALETLRELHWKRNRRPLADTIARFLDATRAHAGVANWPNGEQALANVLRVLELARRAEAQGAPSFRAFTESLEDKLERGEGVDAPVVEERAAGVRIMTVHKAKGLEFPVVILCDPLHGVTRTRPSRYVDSAGKLWAAPLAGCSPVELTEHAEEVLEADAAEEVRLSYVAATRARELLVVPCVGDEAQPGWVDPLHRALHPAFEARRQSEPAPGCPDFGEDSVLDRGPDPKKGTEASVRPGLHRIGEGGMGEQGVEHEVVWWDPATLELGRAPRGGLRRTALLAPDDGEGRGAERVEAHLAWVAAREATRERGARASWKVRPVTAVAHEVAEAVGATTHAPRIVEVEAGRATRPGGKRFGTLVHAVLGECALDADAGAVLAMARHQGRLIDAPDAEIDAASEVARATLAHPILRAAAEAERRGECRREAPITVPLDDGTSAEGVVDLAYREEGRWVVVDFKTDRETGAKVHHAVQLEIYAKAVAAATGEEVETILLYV